MVVGKVNEDLQAERKKCDFSVEELTNVLDGGVSKTERRRYVESKVLSIEGLKDKIPEEYLSHKEKYENAIRKGVIYTKTFRKLADPKLNEMEKVWAMHRSLLSNAVFKDNSPMALHYMMFMPTIMGQGTEEQKAFWMKRASNMEIIGAYAQTELGHGTFLRGLETTATYDPSTEEFILHTPTLTAHKWWPGNLGHTTNHCIVMAQLYTNGNNYGVQPFIVQIRDEETHMPLPGVKVGEIGVKLAFNTVNNGFLGFNHYRIPRNNMLMKNAQVLKDGTFISLSNDKLKYGAMVFVRVMIVSEVANRLSLASTIAVRYSAVRRQSKINPNEPECQILEYTTQQHKLFIGMASAYAFSMTANCLWDMFQKVNKELAVGNTDNLPELHALSCCLKAVASSDSATMIERMRMACGGHGFMLSSNLPQTYGLVAAACTYEGENTVLMLQTARYLVKMWEGALKKDHRQSPSLYYMKYAGVYSTWNNSVPRIIIGFQRVAFCKISAAVNALKKYEKKGLSHEDAWNKVSIQLVQATEAHCRAVILLTFFEEVNKITSIPVKRVLDDLVELYAVYWSLEKVGDLLLYTSLNEARVIELRSHYEYLLERLRKNAVGIVDAFDFKDEILNSALGAYDGRVYERLMEEALKSPLNAEPVNQSFHKYLKPFMQGKL